MSTQSETETKMINSKLRLALAALALSAAAGVSMPGQAEAGWQKCATEPNPCRSTQKWDQVVRFGLSSKKNYLEKVEKGRNGIGCDRANFGGDPAPYKKKHCYIWRYSWKRCASELGNCDFPQRATQVRFGTTPHKKGKYIQKTVTGAIRCDRPSFRGDPTVGKTKACWYWDTPR